MEIEDDVFLGPSCVLTNVTNPRAQVNRHNLYEKTLIRRGATIGANATILCGVTIGRYAFVGAGAVVTKDVPDYALVIGQSGAKGGLDEPPRPRAETRNRWRSERARSPGSDTKKSMIGLRCLDLE